MADVVQKSERLTRENIEAVTRLTKGVESESHLKTGSMETRSLYGMFITKRESSLGQL